MYFAVGFDVVVGVGCACLDGHSVGSSLGSSDEIETGVCVVGVNVLLLVGEAVGVTLGLVLGVSLGWDDGCVGRDVGGNEGPD